jgi:hypothetical protein
LARTYASGCSSAATKFCVSITFTPGLDTMMLGLAKRVKAKILQASTSEVYGGPSVHPQKEDSWGNVNPTGCAPAMTRASDAQKPCSSIIDASIGCRSRSRGSSIPMDRVCSAPYEFGVKASIATTNARAPSCCTPKRCRATL